MPALGGSVHENDSNVENGTQKCIILGEIACKIVPISLNCTQKCGVGRNSNYNAVNFHEDF